MSKPSFKETRPEDLQTELWVSRLLKGGVNAALALVVAGFVLNYFQGHSWLSPTDMQDLMSDSLTLHSDPPRNLAELYYGFRNLESLTFIQSAILILILLPAFRVALLLGSFLRQRDWTFSVLAFLVLAFMSAGTIFRILH